MDFETTISQNDFKIPIIVIYENPRDYPGKLVARLFDRSTPTPYVALADTMEDIRSTIPLSMICLRRQFDDDPCIAEVWI